jgi:hypothetical protein
MITMISVMRFIDQKAENEMPAPEIQNSTKANDLQSTDMGGQSQIIFNFYRYNATEKRRPSPLPIT